MVSDTKLGIIYIPKSINMINKREWAIIINVTMYIKRVVMKSVN